MGHKYNDIIVSSCFLNTVPFSSSDSLTVLTFSHLYSTPTASEYDFVHGLSGKETF